MAASGTDLIRSALRRLSSDPRYGQIVALTCLAVLAFGVFDVAVHPWHATAALLGALGAEWLGRRSTRARAEGGGFDPLSPTITALSLTLLLRTPDPSVAFAAGAIGVGSKFLIRANGRHFFNPANLGIVLVVAAASGGLAPAAWVSPGQWGALGLLAIALAGVGSVVAGRAARLDTTAAFLGMWAALTFGRAAYLGDPMAIPLHQLQSGAVLIFAFFMISDPATTPRARWARIVHAAAVAALGFTLQMMWLSDVGPIHALILLAPLVPLLDFCARRLATPRARDADAQCPGKEADPCPTPSVEPARSLEIAPR